eukprot:352333-Chlamydomonas_euryale.AAC.2
MQKPGPFPPPPRMCEVPPLARRREEDPPPQVLRSPHPALPLPVRMHAIPPLAGRPSEAPPALSTLPSAPLPARAQYRRWQADAKKLRVELARGEQRLRDERQSLLLGSCRAVKAAVSDRVLTLHGQRVARNKVSARACVCAHVCVRACVCGGGGGGPPRRTACARSKGSAPRAIR